VFVCILPEKTVPEMTYTVSGGTLNPTHSLILNIPSAKISEICNTLISCVSAAAEELNIYYDLQYLLAISHF